MRISDWSSDVCSSDLHRRTGNRPAPTLYSYRMPESVISIWPKARVGTLWRYKRYKRIHPVRNPARPARETGRHSATGQFDGSFMTAALKNGPRIVISFALVALIWRGCH